jgi:hypothetical protein
MRDSYHYFNEVGHPISVADFARMFDCSSATARKAIDGSHPAYGEDAVTIEKPKRPVGRPSKGVGPHNRDKTHCYQGHEFTVDNVYSYTKRNGQTTRKCRTCQRANMQNYYRRNAR